MPSELDAVIAEVRKHVEMTERVLSHLDDGAIKERSANHAADLRALLAALDEARELLSEIASSGVEFDDPRIGYLTVQIDRPTWDAIRAARAVPPTREGA